MNNRQHQTILFAAFTAILIGYLSVWLPNEAVGLSFLGVEIGEWVKFLPQLQTGEIGVNRNLFYLPPVSLGIMMVLLSTRWPNNRWQTWVMRGLAVLVALLAFPSIDAIRFEPNTEWLLRILMVSLVVILAGIAILLSSVPDRLIWLVMGLIATAGMLLPTWAYYAVRPAVEVLWRHPAPVGVGVWLNLGGHLGVFLIAILYFVARGVVPKGSLES